MPGARLTALAAALALAVLTPAAMAQASGKSAPRPQAAATPTLQPPIPVMAPFSARADQPGGFTSAQRALIDRVSLYLSSIQTLVGNFAQVGPDGTRSEGQLYMQKPGRIRFTYNPPSVIDVVSDGSFVAVRDRRLSTQDTYPLSQTPLRYLLADRIDLLRDTNVVSCAMDDVFITVVVQETQPFIGTSKLMMMFGAKDLQLRQWTVTDPQGYDTTVAVYNLDTTKRPDPSLFVINNSNNGLNSLFQNVQ